jgi:integrase
MVEQTDFWQSTCLRHDLGEFRGMKTKAFRGIYKMAGSRYYWYRWMEKGKRFAVSLETEDETEALLKKRDIVADVEKRGSEVYRSRPNTPAPANEFAKTIAEYLADGMSRNRRPLSPGTAKTIGYELNRFAADSGVHGLRDLKPDSMALWLRSIKTKKSAETVRSYGRDLKAFRRWLLDQKLAHKLNEISLPDAPPVGRKNWLEQAEVDRVITAAAHDLDLAFILHCGFNAGLRRAEIIAARVDWFDLKVGLIHVFSGNGFTTKDKQGRSIPLKREFNEFLKTYLNSKEGYLLEPERMNGKRYRFDPNRRVRTHFRNCKVRCSWHDMRRSFASNLVSRGESIYIVAGWLGDGVAVVERSYGHVAPSSGDIDR